MEYNFNEHIVEVLANRFGGSERKETVLLDDDRIYLLKLPDPTREKDRSISYINNAVSEYIGCQIFASVGMETQKVILGTYTNERGKIYIACGCQDIIPDGYVLAEAEKQSLGSEIDSKLASQARFSTLGILLRKNAKVSLEELKKWYADLFVMDAFIGNTDRHNGNWGFLSSKREMRIAPVYDCGSSLSPLLSDEELTEKKAHDMALNVTSAIRDENGKCIQYKDYLLSGQNEEVNAALIRMVPKIHMDVVREIVEETPYIAETRKEFYITMLEERYELVLLPALEKTHHRGIVIAERECSHDELYESYKNMLGPLAGIPVGESERVQIGEGIYQAFRASKRYVDIQDMATGESLAVLSVRRQSKDMWESLEIVRQKFSEPKEIQLLHGGVRRRGKQR